MTLRVLCVAEKNETAKEISRLLSQNKFTRREGFSKLNKIYQFPCQIMNTDSNVTMTSVCGHLMDLNFDLKYRHWHDQPPVSLFTAPITQYCPEESISIVKTIMSEAKLNEVLVLWTDCDREGEYIASEIRQACVAANPDIKIHRARFSEITVSSVQTAIQQLDVINERLVAAVSCRKEVDLRIGAAFTRFLSLRLQKVFPAHFTRNQVVSYGPCQFPTLGFVVDRFEQLRKFVPEKFYKLRTVVSRGDRQVNFSWSRQRTKERREVEQSRQICNQQAEGFVYKVVSKCKEELRPLPLDTVELEKNASRKLDMNAKEVMMIAENLYTQGLISYPRTETNCFPSSLDLVPLLQEQTQAEHWGDTARQILTHSPTPRQGHASDQTHPPIHPIKYTSRLQGDEEKVYEFIVRHFLACCYRDAQVDETTVDLLINTEPFSATGLVVKERNYLNVYPYEVCHECRLPDFTQGDRIQIGGRVEMVECETTPPSLLKEADLIELMHEHGIGTDATHSGLIDRIKRRGYVDVEANGSFLPSKLGRGLVEGYKRIGHNLANPELRAEFEKDLTAICVGDKQESEVTGSMVHIYQQIFHEVSSNVSLIDQSLSNHFGAPKHIPLEYLCEGREQISSPPRDVFPLPNKDVLYSNIDSIETFLQPIPMIPNPFIDLMRGKRFANGPCSPSKISKLEPEITCYCREPAAFLSVMKQGPDTGKKFYQCKANCCSFFQWETEYDSYIAPNIDTHNTQSSQSPLSVTGNTGLHDLLCDCGDVAKLINVRKTAPDKGRRFFICPNSGENDCKFFKWIDDNQTGTEHDTPVNSFASLIDDFTDSVSLTNSSHGVTCYCGDTAKFLTVKKNNENKGRKFYACPKPKNTECGFFEWADEGTATQPNIEYSQSVVCECKLASKILTVKKDCLNKGRKFHACPNPRAEDCGFFQWSEDSFSERTPIITSQDENNLDIHCQCGLTSKILTVRKDSPNKGRKFYTCPKPQGKGCNFFMWYGEDTIADNPNSKVCECGTPARLLTVKKESQNKGRQFYNCAKLKQQQCDFFQWADEDTTTTVGGFSHMDQDTTNLSFNDDNQEVYCPCGLLAKLLVVKKDGRNRGRKFYTCPNPRATGCGFFQWADGDQFDTEQSSQRTVCECGIYAKFLTVKKEGPNKGREFYTCPRSRGNCCDFFKWADELEEN